MLRIVDTLARIVGRPRPELAHLKASATGSLIAVETLGRPVWTPRDYAAFAREGFMGNAIVYRSVRMIAEAAASIPVLFYERDAEIAEHPLIDLIRRPSPDHTGADFLEAWYGFLLVAGNAYVEAVAAGGRLRELHILRPDRMKVVPGAEGWPEAYEYTAGGSTVRFDAEPVPGVRPILHVRLFHPANDHYGMSPIEAAASAIDLHNTAARWNKALLDNSARPSGALVYAAADGRMTAEQFQRLKAELEQGFQGAKQAGRPLLLEGGLDWKPLSLSPKDMDFVEAKNAAAREIALALGVPPMLLGIPGDNTYATSPVTRVFGGGRSEPENVHTRQGAVDWAVSIDQLEATLPNAKSVSLVVSWFGNDLRAGACVLRPGVDTATKTTSPIAWSVAGLARDDAHLVSLKDGRPAYGGTPSDQTVIGAIQDLKARGFSVTLTPFILMDVPDDNALPDPYSVATAQPAYPWRGRITVDPAPGQPGTPDKTAAAAAQIAAFVGTAHVSDFAVVEGAVVYSGPEEWSLRRMVLHYAHLALAAGGVSAFVIGTELRGLSQVRSGAASYPFVTALVDLAADVKGVLGGETKVTYAADWSEYFGHQPADGSGDVFFHLDPLWSSAAIDAIGIDVYWPLADWRDGTGHLDAVAGARSTYDLAYLRSNIRGGEGFDWYYASAADRGSQVRSPITDGAGKPWVFRYKDVTSWWQNPHFDRPGGSESASATAWVPQSKPFWLMEIGCPAVDKGANQPNVFVDPKSSETALPYFSRGTRDDLMQRRYLRAFIEALDPASLGYVADANPVSSLTAERMVDLDRIHVYTWDARPHPVFPANTDVWGDGDNWRLGHWLNGRFGGAPLAEAVEGVLDDYGFADYEAGGLNGTVPGFVIDRVMSPRDALAPLELAYFFDSIESGGRIVFRHRGAAPPVLSLSEDDLVEERAGDALLTLTRGQETELPASAKISYVASSADYRQAVAEARRLTGASGRVAQAELPMVLDFERASEVAESWLFEAWASRERAAFKLPPSALAVEPGDVLAIEKDGGARLVRVTEIGEHGVREVEGRAIDPEVYGGVVAPPRVVPQGPPVLAGQPLLEFLDLPLLRGDEPPEAGYVAALQTPWPGGVAVYGSPETTGYVLRALASAPAVIGTMLDPLPKGPTAVIDRAARVRVMLFAGELASVTRLQLLAGKNLAAVRNEAGAWEVLQFETAALVAPSTYELAGLLRGQAGTELAMRAPLAAGATFVLLSSAIAPINLTLNEIRLPLNWRYGPASRDIGDASYGTAQHTFAACGLRPLAPVHVRGSRSGDDLSIRWVRRARMGGDNWDAAEVPLGEDGERYEIDILDGASVKRTLTATSPGATYAAAEQVADFGAVQSAVSVNIYQLGAVYGRGSACAVVV